MVFPANPTNGQRAFVLGKRYRYASSKLSWEIDRASDVGEVSSAGVSVLIRVALVPDSVAINSTTNPILNLFTAQNGAAEPQNPMGGDAFNSISSALTWLRTNNLKVGAGTKVILNLGPFEHVVDTELSLEIGASSITFRGGLPGFGDVYDLMESDIRSLTSSNSSSVQSSIREKTQVVGGRSRIRFLGSGCLFTGSLPTALTASDIRRGFIEEVAFENLVMSAPTIPDGSRACVFMGGSASLSVTNCAFEDIAPNLFQLSRFCRGSSVKRSVFTNARCITSIGSRVEVDDCCFFSREAVASQNGSVQISNCLMANRDSPIVVTSSDLSITDSLIRRSTSSCIRADASTVECIGVEAEDSFSLVRLVDSTSYIKDCTARRMDAATLDVINGSSLVENLTSSEGTGNPSVLSASSAHVVVTEESNLSNNSQPLYRGTRGASISIDASTVGTGVQAGEPVAETVSTNAIVTQTN